jgi:hypothetical protein
MGAYLNPVGLSSRPKWLDLKVEYQMVFDIVSLKNLPHNFSAVALSDLVRNKIRATTL